MTPFLQLRLWWLRAASGDKLAATLAVVVVLGPRRLGRRPDHVGRRRTCVAGPRARPPAPAPAGATPRARPQRPGAAGGHDARCARPAVRPRRRRDGGARAVGTGGSAATRRQAAAIPRRRGTTCPQTPDGAPGITDDTITIDVALLDLAGPIGNGAVGQNSADEQQRIAEAVVDDINARRRRRLPHARGALLQGEPDQPERHAGGVHPDGAGAPRDRRRLRRARLRQRVQLHRPAAGADDQRDQRPADRCRRVLPVPGVAVRGPVLGDARRGPGSARAGFLRSRPAASRKLGVLMDECSPDSNEVFLTTLEGAGIARGDVSIYTFACPESGFASPADMAQAVAQHRSAGVEPRRAAHR